MKHMLIPAALVALALGANVATAACYADYKAKQDNPLKLHYGVIELPDRACRGTDTATPIVERRIRADGWTLLSVLSVFGDEGLEQRKESAGKFFLRY